MKKTSVYLTESEAETLRNLAEREGRSQAAVLREALSIYDGRSVPDRDFEMEGIFDGDGTSIADVPDDELMKGFGEDSFGS
ncbi:MAG: CopG family transcriptional regulator [Tepidiformaceae bacterium]